MSRANPLTTHSNAGIASWNFKLVEPFQSGKPFSHRALYDFLYDREPLLARGIGPHMTARRDTTDSSAQIDIILYDTSIIRYYPDGTFSVDNGGFNTPTTTERLSAVTPEGFWAYHHRKRLGLMGPGTTHGDAHGDGVKLWPLNHETRINPLTKPPTKITTGEI